MRTPIRVEEVVARPLGAGATDLVDYLWLGRCQTCGTDLDGESGTPGEVTVAVDEYESSVWASLHHRACRRAEWRWRGEATGDESFPYVTCSSAAVMLPLTVSGIEGMTPAIVVNPSLERLQLSPGSRPVWQASLAKFHTAGLRAPGREPVPREPLRAAHWRRAAHLLTVTLTLGRGPDQVVHTEVPATMQQVLTEGSPLLLAITHAVDPRHLVDLQDLAIALLTGRVLCGWVAPATLTRP